MQIGQEIPSDIDFLRAVAKILNVILDAELQGVFGNWIECVKRVTEAGGNYSTW
jgi:hypothetical protein